MRPNELPPTVSYFGQCLITSYFGMPALSFLFNFFSTIPAMPQILRVLQATVHLVHKNVKYCIESTIRWNVLP